MPDEYNDSPAPAGATPWLALSLAVAALILFAAPLVALVPLAGLSAALVVLKLLGVVEVGWAWVGLPAALAAAWAVLALLADRGRDG